MRCKCCFVAPARMCVTNHEEMETTSLRASGNLWFSSIFCTICSSGHRLQRDTVEPEETQEKNHHSDKDNHSSFPRNCCTAQTCVCCQTFPNMKNCLVKNTQADSKVVQKGKKTWELARNMASEHQCHADTSEA